MKSLLNTVLLALCAVAWCGSCEAALIRYTFDAWDGPPIRVYASRPPALAPDRPVVFVMHGVNRNADDYRDQWHELAMEHDFLLIVPEFSREDFPGSEGYNLGNLFGPDGKPRPRSQWSYSAIEPIFDDARRRFGMRTRTYALYGHSAGAQFVHRFVFHVPDARVSQVVPANAGWYMMPGYEADYPYGLRGSLVTGEMLEHALALPVTVLLGDRDIDPDHPNLRRTPEAMAQGAFRRQRGERFFEAARAKARQAGVPFNWRIEYVEGADHDNRKMAPAAVPLLLPEP